MSQVPTEAEEGKALVAYLRLRKYRFTHIANETGRDARMQGIRNKQQGVSKGFPDYLVIVKGQLAFIELKRTKGSKTSPEQLEWLKALAATGAQAAVCHGWLEAREFIESIEHPDQWPKQAA